MPNKISKEAALDKIEDLIQLLKAQPPHHPFATAHDDTITALDKLSDVFINHKNTPQDNLPQIKKQNLKPILHDCPSPRVPLKNTHEVPRVDHNDQSNNYQQTQHRYFTRSEVSNSSTPPAVANAVHNIETGMLEEHRQLRLGKDKVDWIRSFSNELGRLAQGIRDIKGTDCITFICHKDIPIGHKIAYARIVCNIRPQKKGTDRTRMTIGGNLLDYANLITLKLLLNSVLSTPEAKFMTIDIKNFYLETKLKNKQCMSYQQNLFLMKL